MRRILTVSMAACALLGFFPTFSVGARTVKWFEDAYKSMDAQHLSAVTSAGGYPLKMHEIGAGFIAITVTPTQNQTPLLYPTNPIPASPVNRQATSSTPSVPESSGRLYEIGMVLAIALVFCFLFFGWMHRRRG